MKCLSEGMYLFLVTAEWLKFRVEGLPLCSSIDILTGAPNEDIVQNHLKIALLNVV